MRTRFWLLAAFLLATAPAVLGADDDAKALWRAAKKNDAAAIAALAASGADINAVDGNGRSALWLAAEEGNAAALERLLGLGANLALQDRKGRTAADVAAAEGHQSIRDRLAFEVAVRANTIQAYADFLRNHSFSSHEPLRQRASTAMQEIHWQEAVTTGSIEKLRQFKRAYPRNPHSTEVDSLVELIEWQALQQPSLATVEGYRQFVQSYPNSAHAAEANTRADALLAEQAKARERRSAEEIIRVRTNVSRGAQRWHDGVDITVSDFLQCAMGASNCVSNVQSRGHAAGPKPGHVFLIVEADVMPREHDTVQLAAIAVLRTFSGESMAPFVWYPDPGNAGWISGGLTQSLLQGKQTTLRWLYELRAEVLPGAQVEIWGRAFDVDKPR